MIEMKNANRSTSIYTCVCPNEYCGEELTNRFLRNFVTKKSEGIKPFDCPACNTKLEVRKRGAKQHEVGLV
jgi:hypothetical protein